jgi:hypothetical protein
MSEYQWIHFRAGDQPLDDDALEFMRSQSTRASISRWEFTNEYHFGDFHGDTNEMLRRGYDVHLHYANFMIRNLAFRLPRLPCDETTFGQFAVNEALEWQPDKKGSAGILWVTPEIGEYAADYIDGLESILNQNSPAREMLLKGDLRPLYLFWLAGCYDDECLEPPVPAGLQQIADGNADDCLLAIVEFLEVDHDLLAIAAKTSPPAPSQTDSCDFVKDWLDLQSESTTRKLAEQLLTDAAARQRVLREIRAESDKALWPAAEPSRTWGAMFEDVKKLRQIRREKAAETKRIQEEKQKAAAREARQKHLKQVAADPMAVIRRIDDSVGTKNRMGYNEAASHLKDFAEALGHAAAQAEADRLRREFPRLSALRDELERAGF